MDKPRLVQVTDPTEDAYLRAHAGELDVPFVFFVQNIQCPGGQSLWCDPDQLAMFRAGRIAAAKGEHGE